VLGIGFVVLTVCSVEITSQNWFCNSCHIMNPYYDSWKTGSHSQVDCTQCHIPPGVGNFVSAKLNGLGQVVDDVLDRTSSKPSAAVPDASCTRAGCHSVEKLTRDGVRKNEKFLFDHGKHLGKEYDGIEIHCTTCHSHVEGNSHFKVNTNACVTCHLARPQHSPAIQQVIYSMSDGGKKAPATAPATKTAPAPVTATAPVPTTLTVPATAVATTTATGPAATQSEASLIAAAKVVPPEKLAPNNCRNCHEPPQKEFTYRGLKVVHSEYLAYGAACESCHSGVTAKPQPVLDERCFNCHEFGMERFTTSAETHHVHTAGAHKVECLSCHGVTPHGPKAQAVRMDRLECESCHTSQHSVQQTTYKKLALMGESGHGVAPPTADSTGQNLPAVSPMFMAHVDCTACHVDQKPLTVKPTSGATVAKASAKSCDTCHKSGLGDQLVPLWQKNTHALYDTTLAMVPSQEAATTLSPEQARRVYEARQLLELVRVDGSWGVHNPRYTQKVLEDAQQKLSGLPKPVAAKGVK
jgi:nitrate/TMAO reductase-like tetraheme cytochrome c subunit